MSRRARRTSAAPRRAGLAGGAALVVVALALLGRFLHGPRSPRAVEPPVATDLAGADRSPEAPPECAGRAAERASVTESPARAGAAPRQIPPEIEEWLARTRAELDLATATPTELCRALSYGWVTRAELGDAAFDALLARIVRPSFVELADDSANSFLERETAVTPPERWLPAGQSLDPQTQAEVDAVVRQHEPYRRELAERALAELRRSLVAAWDGGRYLVSAEGEEPEFAWTPEEQGSGYYRSVSTGAFDRGFQMAFSSAHHPALEALLVESKELRAAVDAEVRRIVEAAGGGPAARALQSIRRPLPR